MNSNKKEIPAFFMQRLQEQYSVENVNKIIDGYTKPRKATIRINTLKSNKDEVFSNLKLGGIEYSQIKWSDDALIVVNVDEKVIQQLEIYKEGKIYLQSLSSMLPPIILEPKENEDILDMCAAPRK